MQKKGVELSLTVIVVAIVLLVVAVVLISFSIGIFRKVDPYFTEQLTAAADQACHARGIRMKAESKLPKENDIDGDDRPDFVCDVCVCKDKCNNNIDKNDNHVPDDCEDFDDKADPWITGCKRQNRQAAFEGGKAGNIVVLDAEQKLWQCRVK